MAGDLGVRPAEVHEKAREVLDFWFGEVPRDKWFAEDDAIDAQVAMRFRVLQDDILAGGAAGWQDDVDTMLAAIIVLDQFSRNLHRGDPAAYAGDPLALTLARQAIAKGWDADLPPERRQFLYMPLMHAEDAAAQAESVACFTRLGDPAMLDDARAHADAITLFGRFPQRNEALKQRSTPLEQEYLSRPYVDR